MFCWCRRLKRQDRKDLPARDVPLLQVGKSLVHLLGKGETFSEIMDFLDFPEFWSKVDTPETKAPFLSRQDLSSPLPSFQAFRHPGPYSLTLHACDSLQIQENNEWSRPKLWEGEGQGRRWDSVPKKVSIVSHPDILYFIRSDEHPFAALCQRMQHSCASQPSFSLSFL